MTQLQLVTLASIVEGEARADDERETIAGVYHNRLRIGMALQADPTVQYAICSSHREAEAPALTRRTISSASPYNTYLNRGLPPGTGELTQPAEHRGVALSRQGSLSVLRRRGGRAPRVLPDVRRAPAGDRPGAAGADASRRHGVIRDSFTSAIARAACSDVLLAPESPTPPPPRPTGRRAPAARPPVVPRRWRGTACRRSSARQPAKSLGARAPSPASPLVARRSPGPDAPVVRLAGDAPPRPPMPTDAPMTNPGGAIRRTSATGRSSGPRCTPGRAGRRAPRRAGRSPGPEPGAPPPARGQRSTCSRAMACLSRSCTEVDPAPLGRQRQRHESRPSTRRSSVTSISRTNDATLFPMTSPTPRLQGIRGATTVDRNDATEILAATDELLRTLIETNELQPDDIVSGLFTVTRDLDAAFPARAAEEFGWNIVALAARARRSRCRARCPAASGFWCTRTPAAAGPKSSIAISAGPRCSVPTARDRRPGHCARRRALGARPSLDLSQRRDGGARPSRASCRSTIRAGGSSARDCYSPAPRSGFACWNASDRRWTPPGGGSTSPRPRSPDGTSTPPPTAWSTARATALPSLVVDRYDRWLVAQILSAGLETMRQPIVDALLELFDARGHPAPQRRPGRPPRGPSDGDRGGHRLGASGNRGARRQGAVSRGAVGRTEDRRVPRPAPQPPAGGRAHPAGRTRARLLHLSRLVRPAPGGPRAGACWRSTRARRRWSAARPTRRSTA